MSPKHQLEALIYQRRFELQTYANRPDAKDGYLQKQNAHLAELVDIHNRMANLPHYYLWSIVETAWEQIRQQDSNHAGIAVELITNPNGILCRLPIKLYEHGL